ncbi:MAG: cation:proton antiporter [Pseudomonadota bacterium]
MTPGEVLPNVLVILVSAIVVVAVFRRLNLSPVLGYFVAGSIIGPFNLNLIQAEDTHVLAEVGIVFLLFAIGLELTLERLKSMRVHVFGFGSLQVILTAVILGVIYSYFDDNYAAMIVVGGGLALSSTAIVLQVIAESRLQSNQIGRLSLAVLLMQDFAVVPLLVIIPLFAGQDGQLWGAMGYAMLKAFVALIGIFVLGRLFLRPLFNMISSASSADNNEIFIATTILISLGTAFATEHFGLSLALGAFVAGVLVAETEYQHQAEESIKPFKGLLLGLFFMTVGMKINLEIMIERLPEILLMVVGLISIKAIIIILLCIIFRFSLGSAIHSGLLLSQGGEFGFILFTLAAKHGIIDNDHVQNLLLTITTTMAITPVLANIGGRISRRLEQSATKDSTAKSVAKELADINNHVIIAGCGRVGKMVSRLLDAENVRHVIMETDPRVIDDAKNNGYPVYLGDSANLENLKNFGIERSQSIIISYQNTVIRAKTVRTIRDHSPNIPIIVRATDLSNATSLYSIGVTDIVPETYETGLQLAGAVLKAHGISEFEVSRIKNRFRSGSYLKAALQEGE